jgi:hypothetical protein
LVVLTGAVVLVVVVLVVVVLVELVVVLGVVVLPPDGVTIATQTPLTRL